MTPESTLRAINALERGADEIMRRGDPQIAVELYSAALILRMESGQDAFAQWRDHFAEESDVVT